jgi:hypothetical protein
MQVNTSVRLERIEELPDGSISAYFSDNPAVGLSFSSQQDMDTYLSNVELWIPSLKAMLLLDWSQENVLGKTAVLSCADPNDYWVVAS